MQNLTQEEKIMLQSNIEKILKEDYGVNFSELPKLSQEIFEYWIEDLEKNGSHLTEENIAQDIYELTEKATKKNV